MSPKIKKRKIKDLSSEEFEFFLKAPLKKYRGKYVAILGDRVVASGENAKEVWKEARQRYPDKLPTLAKLPKEETLILRILWNLWK